MMNFKGDYIVVVSFIGAVGIFLSGILTALGTSNISKDGELLVAETGKFLEQDDTYYQVTKVETSNDSRLVAGDNEYEAYGKWVVVTVLVHNRGSEDVFLDLSHRLTAEGEDGRADFEVLANKEVSKHLSEGRSLTNVNLHPATATYLTLAYDWTGEQEPTAVLLDEFSSGDRLKMSIVDLENTRLEEYVTKLTFK